MHKLTNEQFQKLKNGSWKEDQELKEILSTKSKCIDLSCSDLSGSDLSGSILRDSNLRGSDLRGSNLSGSILRGSNLSSSDLRGSDLSGSDLRDSNLMNVCGNNKEIRTIQTGCYICNLTKDFMQIGCKKHTYKEWFEFTDKRIENMDGQTAVEFWGKYKDLLFKHAELCFGINLNL